MGKFKHVGEKIKQALGMNAGSQRDWKPSSNLRNEAMVNEARKFAVQLKALHADLTSLGKGISGSMVTLKAVLTAPLPRAHDDSVLGVSPVDKEERIVGNHVNIDSISAASSEMSQRLQAEVLHPLEQWLSAYRTIKERNKKCESLRLDLDTRRRSLAVLEDKLEKMKTKEKGDPKELEKLEYKLQTERDKTVRATQRYAEVEAEVFNALLTLIRDTCVLREYAAAALLILERCFQLSYFAFDLNCPSSMPAMPNMAIAPPAPTLALPWVSSDGGSIGMASSSGGGALTSMLRSSGGGVGASMRISQQDSAPLQSSKPASPPHEEARNPFSDPSRANTPYTGSNGSPPQQQPQLQQQQRAPSTAFTSVAQLPSPSPNAAYPGRSGAPSPMPDRHHIKSPSTDGMPPPPAWYNEAKLNSRPPTAYDNDSDDEAPNPFAKRDQLSPHK